jgi:hypothetical protein
MPAEPGLHPWRKYLRFSVRGLIVLVLAMGTGLGWIVREAHIQRDAVAAILKTGGVVFYDWDWPDGAWISAAKPRARSWLVDLVGVDYFGHAAYVGFPLHRRAAATDATLAEVGRLTRLQRLDVFSSPVTDAGLVHPKGLTKLSVLGLAGTQVTDAGLAHLKGLTELNYLDLAGTQVTDAGVRELSQALPGLKIVR